ncbi:BAG domain-containing protein [Caerostris extrusa]|uniref:BAG domain-containing protein n=1 Tax=Caerostris extrusa TaxID=172846 RepID=A0AAV4UDN2_CAEEX|nr:BAG domain-containing protein [Caerostris extrusa]
MDFRRIPFQFSTTDPVKRQEELQKRFGFPAKKDKMRVDFANRGAMGTAADNFSSSPRLQHRVPIFVEGSSEPVKSSVDSRNIDSGKKPQVRIVPIQIEGENPTTRRHRHHSDSFETANGMINRTGSFVPEETFKHPVPDASKAPRVCNIPIKIVENNDDKPTSPVKSSKVKSSEKQKVSGVKLNGCSASKVAKVSEKKGTPEELALKKIENVLEKLKGYHEDIEKFTGTIKDKQYRYLDEMLTRCMLDLDVIDTMGLETVRLSRKAAVKKVQASLDLLESKVDVHKPMEVDLPADKVEGEEISSNNFEQNEVVEPDNVDIKREVSVDKENFESQEQIVENIKHNGDSKMDVETECVNIPENEEMVHGEQQISTGNINVSKIQAETVNESVDKEIGKPVEVNESDTMSSVSLAELTVEEPISDVSLVDGSEKDLKCNPDVSSENEKQLEIETNERTDSNLEMEMSETSDIPNSLVIPDSDKTVNSESVSNSTGLDSETIISS